MCHTLNDRLVIIHWRPGRMSSARVTRTVRKQMPGRIRYSRNATCRSIRHCVSSASLVRLGSQPDQLGSNFGVSSSRDGDLCAGDGAMSRPRLGQRLRTALQLPKQGWQAPRRYRDPPRSTISRSGHSCLPCDSVDCSRPSAPAKLPKSRRWIIHRRSKTAHGAGVRNVFDCSAGATVPAPNSQPCCGSSNHSLPSNDADVYRV